MRRVVIPAKAGIHVARLIHDHSDERHSREGGNPHLAHPDFCFCGNTR